MLPTPFPAQPDDRALAFTRITAEVEHTIEIQRSVFLTRLVPVADESSAREVIEDQRKAHHGARHHCSAFVLGPDREVQRSSDDGEPGGTAGVPMMQALLQRETASGHRDLTDVVAVVTRWFGGILLGAGGLVRAYSDSVSQALDVATEQRWTRRRQLLLDVPYDQAGKAENVLRRLESASVSGTDYGPRALTMTLVADDYYDALAQAEVEVSQALGGTADLRRGEAVWAP
ncbi:MAG: IMPACT family protein [Galactobacter sp.]|uniref:IMPACT family protein n=1 Tax=Galactobacter sp. TaxID=2676125 RepID=UPI00345DA1F8